MKALGSLFQTLVLPWITTDLQITQALPHAIGAMRSSVSQLPETPVLTIWLKMKPIEVFTDSIFVCISGLILLR